MKIKILLFILCSYLCTTAWASDLDKAERFINKGNSLMYISPNDAINAYKQAYEIGLRLSNDEVCAMALERYAWCMQETGDNELSVTLFINALNYCPKEKIEIMSDIKNGLGVAYGALGKVDLAKQYLYESLYLLKSRKSYCSNNAKEGRMYMNLGNIYSTNGFEEKGNYYYLKSLQYAKKSKDVFSECRILTNLGLAGNNYKQRHNYLKQALLFAQKLNDHYIISCCYTGLAECYFNNKQYFDALQALQQSDNYSSDNRQVKIINLKQRAHIYSAQNQFALAYSYQEQALNEQEKVDDAKKLESIEHRITSRQLLKLREQNELQKKENEIYRGRMYLLSSCTLLLGIALFITYRFYGYRRQKKSELMQKQYELEKSQNKVMELEMKQKEEMLCSVNSELQNTQERLSYLRLFLQSRNELLENIYEKIRESYKLSGTEQVTHLKNINSYIKQYQTKEEENNSLQTEEEKQSMAFLQRLKERFPEIKERECKLALFIRSNLSSKEIALLTGKPTKSIEMKRYRLRKALQLEHDENITEFLQGI